MHFSLSITMLEKPGTFTPIQTEGRFLCLFKNFINPFVPIYLAKEPAITIKASIFFGQSKS